MVKKIIGVAVLLAVVLLASYWVVTHFNLNTKIGRGEVTDSIMGCTYTITEGLIKVQVATLSRVIMWVLNISA